MWKIYSTDGTWEKALQELNKYITKQTKRQTKTKKKKQKSDF